MYTMKFDTDISSQHLRYTKGLDSVCWRLGRISEQKEKKDLWVWYDLILKTISLLDKNPDQLIRRCPATPVLIDD